MNLGIFLKKVNIFQENYWRYLFLKIMILQINQELLLAKKLGEVLFVVKRFIREAYKELEDKIDTKNNILIIWKKSVTHEKANFFDTKKDLKNLFEKSGILVEE